MRQKGTHTWEIVIHYHRCLKCGWIIESREDFDYRLGRYQKDLVCPRCQYAFSITKQSRPCGLFWD